MSLKKLNEEIRKCKKCGLWKTNKNAVPGEGPVKAKIILIGQNPGEEENKTGEPFVGKAGKYLDKILKKNKINRKKIFITSILKHKTPNNKKPKADEIKACIPYLIEQINLINPKIIVLMGQVAWTLQKQKSKIKNKNIKYIKTYHPAAAMRFSKIRKKFERDFKKIKWAE